MGRKRSEYKHISKKRLKNIIDRRGETQLSLAKMLDRDKDNLNKQIRTETMEVSLLEEIAVKLNVAVGYLTEEINETDSKNLITHSTERDEDGFLIPTYEETLERKAFSTVEDYFLDIGNTFLSMYKFLIANGYIDGTVPNLNKLQLTECDYIFDQLKIMKRLPMLLQSIEEKREIKNHGKEK